MNCPENLDYNYLKNAGWQETSMSNPYYCELWATENLQRMQMKINQLLIGCGPQKQDVIVPLNIIASVITSVYNSKSPASLGDPYSRFIIPSEESDRNDIQSIIDRTIEIVVTSVRNEYETARNNQKLSIWATLRGDFNKEGLRSHSKIYTRDRRPQTMAFNMNY